MDDFWVKLRGMPYRTTMDDIIEFMSGVEIKGGKRGINFPVNQKNVEWGEAFIELETEEDLEKAKEKNNQHIGRRYIEVFVSSKVDMTKACTINKEAALADNGNRVRRGRSRSPINERQPGNYVLRLKGLPYNAAKGDLKDFFEGLKILPDGMSILVDQTGKALGDAFVQFASYRDAKLAKDRSGNKIGHRYIEVFDSTLDEANTEIRRQMELNEMRGNRGDRSPGVRDEGTRDYAARGAPCSVAMRGISVLTRPDDIFRYFRPVIPLNIEIKFSRSSPDGDAIVDFGSEEEAYSAVSRNRDHHLDGAPVSLTMLSAVPPQHRDMDRQRDHREPSRGGMGGGGPRFGDDYCNRSRWRPNRH